MIAEYMHYVLFDYVYSEAQLERHKLRHDVNRATCFRCKVLKNLMVFRNFLMFIGVI